MRSEPSIVLKPSKDYTLHITAKRYRPDSSSDPPQLGAITLVLLHATSLHKETWEPTLLRVFELAAKSHRASVNIHEAWAIECPNHGESAVLNHAELQAGHEHHCNSQEAVIVSCKKYAHAVHRFMTAGPVDFGGRRLVGIGHSLGGVAMTILQCLEPVIPFSSIILVEPMLSPEGAPVLAGLRKHLIRSACERRDVWSSKTDALKDMTSRARTSPWDRHALSLYAEHALVPHKGIKWDPPYMGVTLACTRDEEARIN
ncbi:hypothetical protein HWV62_34323 [Athelia sp. TMB]|nr:hypothetical protein HWV62_34323 [Athelia sp. TMB]